MVLKARMLDSGHVLAVRLGFGLNFVSQALLRFELLLMLSLGSNRIQGNMQ
jgi:hypothetical protein